MKFEWNLKLEQSQIYIYIYIYNNMKTIMLKHWNLTIFKEIQAFYD